MSFRCPTDAQAHALRMIHECPNDPLWHRDGRNVYGSSWAALWIEEVDREANRARFASWPGCYKADQMRSATLAACVRYGWLSTSERVLSWRSRVRVGPGQYEQRTEPVIMLDLALTEDGELALGLWRERKLNAPPTPMPGLDPDDKELLRLAHEAAARGFALVPDTTEAKKRSRRLARTPYASRGFGGGVSTLSLQVTATGAVEVAPEAADRREARP